MNDEIDQNVDSSPDPAIADARYAAEAEAAGAGWVERKDDIDALKRELEVSREETADANAKFLRARADMDNYKKRIERNYADLARHAKKDLLRKLLGVKDNIERALQYGDSAQGGESIMEGVRLTLYQLEQLLQQEGVQRMDAEGKQFDPYREEAIQSVNDPSVPDQTVIQVARAGYTYVDQVSKEEEVLRPAQVVVSVHA